MKYETDELLTHLSNSMYWAVWQVIGRAFVCLLLELASLPSQPAVLPTAKAKLSIPGIFSEKSLPIGCWCAHLIL